MGAGLKKLLGPGALLEDSAAIDAELGLRTRETEDSLRAIPEGSRRIERWNHLSPEIFQTPYIELAEILERVNPPRGATVLDIGAAYGRLGFLIAARRSDLSYHGIEIVPERASEARRVAYLHGLESPAFIVQLADVVSERVELGHADVFFLYDFGSSEDVDRVFQRLQEIARRREITVVARGGRTRSCIQAKHPWLSVRAPEHFPNHSIFRSA